jgi:hypothetical protein
MGLDFSTLIYSSCQDLYGRPVTINPLMSQPGQPAYGNRGIWTETDENVVADDLSYYQDHRMILDIRDREYGVLPEQGDHVIIPADGEVPAEGEFVITNRVRNGGGETTLTLSEYKP